MSKELFDCYSEVVKNIVTLSKNDTKKIVILKFFIGESLKYILIYLLGCIVFFQMCMIGMH